jgi:hypothetical protein
VADEEIGVLAGARTEAGEELRCSFEVLVLPLSHRGKSGRRMLGSLVAMERPYWLGIWPARRLALGVVQFVGANVYSCRGERIAHQPSPPQRPDRDRWRQILGFSPNISNHP